MIENLNNAYKTWFEARKRNEVIYLPYGIHKTVEPENANEIRKYLNSKNIDLDVYDYDEANEIVSKFEDYGIDFEVPEDNMVDYLIDVNGVYVFIQGTDEYQGHGDSTFNFGVQGIIPNNKSVDEIKMVIDWLCNIFNI